MLFWEVITVYDDYHMEHIDCVENAWFQSVVYTVSTGLYMVDWSGAACQIYVVNDLAVKFPFFENTTNWLTMSLNFSHFPLLSILLL
jgi:hypothetical protein